MRIIVAGGSGFLGTALMAHFAQQHHVTILTRRSAPLGPASPGLTYATWSPNGHSGPWATAIDGADALVNLAGESIAANRWSSAQKQKILESRLLATQSLAAAIRQAARAPPVLVNASAIGYYGDRGEETLTEASSPGSDFLADVCKQWESAAGSVGHLTRVALVRTGIVLDRRGGALPKMLPPFRLFAGGPLGSGSQYMSWIHKDDWVRLVAWMVSTHSIRGPFNATAPNPVTNAEFSKALGRVLNRPSVLPAPAFALRLLLGEMADTLLLGGQRVLPRRAIDSGFSFRFANVDEALADIFKTRLAGTALQ